MKDAVLLLVACGTIPCAGCGEDMEDNRPATPDEILNSDLGQKMSETATQLRLALRYTEQQLAEANSRADKAVAGQNLQESEIWRLRENLDSIKAELEKYKSVVHSLFRLTDGSECKQCGKIADVISAALLYKGIPVPESSDWIGLKKRLRDRTAWHNTPIEIEGLDVFVIEAGSEQLEHIDHRPLTVREIKALYSEMRSRWIDSVERDLK